MNFAAAVGSAELPWFTELNVALLRRIFGDIPIVICDDYSKASNDVKAIAQKYDTYLKVNEVPLGHFAGDLQAYLHALTLAEVTECEIAIKVSQRFMLIHPDVKPLIRSFFERDPNLAVICPGRPNANFIRTGHQQFSRFPMLTDIMFMRRKFVTPEMVKSEYEQQVKNGKHYYDCFVELFWDRIRTAGTLKDKFYLCPELTDHRGGQKHYYLRRYQNTVHDYKRYAEICGVKNGQWNLGERAHMMKRYDPRPRI